MDKAKQIVGFLRGHPRHSLSSQQVLMDVRGITKLYADFDLLVRQRRDGHRDVVAVKRLILLADPVNRRKPGGMRQALYKALDELAAVGVEVVELETNRSTANARERELAIRDAIEEMAQTRKSTRRPGRPEIEWSDEQKTIMRLHWFNHRDYATNPIALKAINAALNAGRKKGEPKLKVSMRQVRRVCDGPSGRPSGGNRPKRAKRP